MAVDRKARKLIEGIEAVAGKAMAEEITSGLKEPTASTKPARKAEWAREIIARMDALLPEEQRRAIMELRRCPSPMAWAKRNRRMWERCANLEGFARNIREGGWANYFCEGDTLRCQISTGVVPLRLGARSAGAHLQDVLPVLCGSRALRPRTCLRRPGARGAR